MKNLAKLLRRSWLETSLDAYLERRGDTGQESGYIHASWLLSTEEEIYNRLLEIGPPGRPPGARLRRMFDDGLDLQRRYIKYFREMGILYEPEGGFDEDRGLRYVDEGHGITGNVDCAIWVPEGFTVPVELKAYNAGLFKRYQYHPRIEHYHQTQMYIYLTNAPYGYLLPECKDNQEINPIKVIRNDEMINTALAKARNVWDRVKKELTNA